MLDSDKVKQIVIAQWCSQLQVTSYTLLFWTREGNRLLLLWSTLILIGEFLLLLHVGTIQTHAWLTQIRLNVITKL